MPNCKALIRYIAVVVLAMAAGFWYGNSRAEKQSEKGFYFREFADVQTRVKVLDLLYKNDSENAIQELEHRLNMDAIIVGPNEDDPRQLGNEERTILQMISKHRNAHPFSDQFSPGIDNMVKKVLQRAN